MTGRSAPVAVRGGLGGSRARRLARPVLPLVLLALVAGLTGCSTKGDIRDVREDLQRLEARQDSIYQLLQNQNRQILDSLTVTTERLLNVRGELANQLTQLQDQLLQVGELTGQVQVRLTQLDQGLATALRQVGATGASGVGPDGGGDPMAGAGAADEEEARVVYEAGREQIERGNALSARRAFQFVADSFPSHPLAPEALHQIGETHILEGEYELALEAFDRVVSLYQDSDAAPRALYRAGVISREQGLRDRARRYFERVISAYPDSDARRLAEDALSRM